MCIKTSHGIRCLLGDSAYRSKGNCQMAVDLERTPRMQPKKNCLGCGNSPRAKIMQCEKRPSGAYRTYA